MMQSRHTNNEHALYITTRKLQSESFQLFPANNVSLAPSPQFPEIGPRRAGKEIVSIRSAV